jgi:YspA, cpYpsA-related SLOG family
MRVLVCGGRDFWDYAMLKRVLDELHTEFNFSVLIHGNASGADQFAGKWASRNAEPCVSLEVYPADWKRYDRSAGSIRNEQMLREGAPALVVAFPGGAGTAHMKRIARAAGIKVLEISSDGTITGK